VRWEHARQGPIPPEEIIRIAEQTGLIRPLTLWVLSQALRQCRAWRRAGRTVDVAVNLSAREVVDGELPGNVLDLLDEVGLPAGALTLEITESSILADPIRAAEIISRLRAMGVRLAIDDFGTGYSSFAQLRRLQVDEIKIDRTFVMDMSSDESDALIVRSIVDLGRNLNLGVVAEGVEDEGTWAALADMGCDFAQGYVLTEPLPAIELERWLADYEFAHQVPAVGEIVGLPTQATRPR
jgi:diguanylate cyclase